MSGYVRQSAADILPTAVIRATPVNNEFNALRDAFSTVTGHKHDGTTSEGHLVPLIADDSGNIKVVTDATNNRVSIFVNVSSAAVEQLRVQNGSLTAALTNTVDLGTTAIKFKDLNLAGTANIPVANITTSATIASATVAGGTINGTVVGNTLPQAITGTTVTATAGFIGGLTGAVTGNTTGTHTGPVVGAITGDVTGNITASTGTSTFNNVTINGGLDMNAGTSATITNLTSPTNSGDAATKGYVDTANALKLNLTGGTMSGAIAMGANKITGLGTPTLSTDAATKTYVDTSISNLVASAPAALDTLNELAAALGNDASFSTTVTNSIASKLPLVGGTMTGAIAMGTNKITGVGNPTLAQDAATKTYVDTADALKLNLSGGTLSGALAMGTNKITGLGDPTAAQDSATKNYVDTQDALKLSLTGGTMSGAIAMGTNKITGLGNPTLAQDAATKNYIDTLFGSTTTAAASAAAAAVSAANAATSEGNALTSANSSASSASASSTSAANALSYLNTFKGQYYGSLSSVPSLDPLGNAITSGDLYFDTTANEMRVYTGSVWKATGSAVNGTSQRSTYTATASQTTFAAVYDVGFIDVY